MAERNFTSDEHALITGAVLGLLIKSGIDARPLIDGFGDYTDVITIHGGPQQVEIRVLPPEGES